MRHFKKLLQAGATKLLVLMLVVATFANADLIDTHIATILNTPLAVNQTGQLEMFDTNLGTLTGVLLTLEASAVGDFTVFSSNINPGSHTFLSQDSFDVILAGPGATATVLLNLTVSSTVAGGAPIFLTIPAVTATGSDTFAVDPGFFSAYEAPGPGNFFNFTLTTSPENQTTVADFDIVVGDLAKAGGVATVTYMYTPVTTAVPEPAAATLTGTALVGLAAAMRRRKTATKRMV